MVESKRIDPLFAKLTKARLEIVDDDREVVLETWSGFVGEDEVHLLRARLHPRPIDAERGSRRVNGHAQQVVERDRGSEVVHSDGHMLNTDRLHSCPEATRSMARTTVR